MIRIEFRVESQYTPESGTESAFELALECDERMPLQEDQPWLDTFVKVASSFHFQSEDKYKDYIAFMDGRGNLIERHEMTDAQTPKS